MELSKLLDNKGLVSAEKLATELHTTKQELEITLGLPAQSTSDKDYIASESAQKVLRNGISILIAASPMAGSPIMAFAWFRSEPLAGFGGRFPEQVMKDGEYNALMAHMHRLSEGGYA